MNLLIVDDEIVTTQVLEEQLDRGSRVTFY